MAAQKLKRLEEEKKEKTLSMVQHTHQVNFQQLNSYFDRCSRKCFILVKSGALGFRGSRKSTPFSAQMAAETAAKVAMEHGLKSIEVYVKGPVFGREAKNKIFTSSRIRSNFNKRCYSIPHNGCRPPKRRRV